MLRAMLDAAAQPAEAEDRSAGRLPERKAQPEPVVEFGAEQRRLIDIADRAAAAIVAGAPSKRLFDSWRCIGRALLLARTAIAERSGGRGGHLGRPWRDWLAARPGLSSLKETERSHSIWLAMNEAEVVSWRDNLPQKQRDRIHHVATARLGYQRHLREQQIIGALTRKREAADQKREDARCRQDRMERALLDLSQRVQVLEGECARLRGQIADMGAQAPMPLASRRHGAEVRAA